MYKISILTSINRGKQVIIILDFETNSANIHDVIEVAAFRVELVQN